MKLGKQAKIYLLLLGFIFSIIAIILMIIGYSKIRVTVNAVDIFDTHTGTYTIEKIVEAVSKNLYYSETHYFIIASGLFMGLSASGIFAVILIIIFSESNNDKRILTSINPVFDSIV